MRIRVRITKPEKPLQVDFIKSYLKNFKKSHPSRFYGSITFVLIILFTIIFRTYVTDSLITRLIKVSENIRSDQINDISQISIEEQISNKNNINILGVQKRSQENKIRTDVGFIDLRVLTLEDFFNHYGSPLADSSDEFIEATERYDVVNWQLLPAIAMAETIGCQTGFSYEQRNCWGWGGSEPNRWEFRSFAEAIDLITYRMIRGYGNNNMNAKDIQSTYCGRTCMQWGWRWAQGVDYYARKINDFGEKYGLPRTNEIYNWS